jgi:hypothetical protein
MARGRREEAWWHTADLMANQVASNPFCEARTLDPAAFHRPSRERKAAKTKKSRAKAEKPIRVPMSVLRGLFQR